MYRLKYQARTRIWLIPLLGLLGGVGLATDNPDLGPRFEVKQRL